MTPQVEASNLITPLINAFKSINNEWYEFMETGVSAYLQSQTEKYYFTNTFLHRVEKVVFDEIYFPIRATYGELTTDFSKLEDVLDEYHSFSLIGIAGSGKTTLIKYIFLQAIRLRQYIPVLIELRKINDCDDSLEKILIDKILKTGLKPSNDILKRTLRSGKFLFLFDGYDEIFSNKKQSVKTQIENFIDEYSANKFIITTRPGSGIEGFDRFYNFRILPLEPEEITKFILKMVDNEERSKRIINIVHDSSSTPYLEFLKNPLLLSMFILAFESHPEIPGRKSIFYRNVFDTLYSKHDGITKNSFPREKRTGLQWHDFENVLSLFSYITLLDGHYSFTYEYLTDRLQEVKLYSEKDFEVLDMLYDLQTTISIIIADGLEYSFPHRSMQEYFAALFISKLETENKKEAYDNLLTILQKASTDNSRNLWSLFLELDEKEFVINFIIPNLRLIASILADKEGEDLVLAYFSILKPNIYAAGKDWPFHIYRRDTIGNSLLEFCGIFKFRDDIWKFPSISGCHKELNNIKPDVLGQKHNLEGARGLNSDNPKVLEILLRYNFNDIIIEMRNDVNIKIKQWELIMLQRKASISNLLSGKKR